MSPSSLSPMASNSGSSTVNLVSFLLLLLISVANTVKAVPAQELEWMLVAMRARGYNLFANAIATSDIHYEVVSGSAFTFFAPINSSLFALDMTTTATDYVTALRCHVVRGRLSMSQLRRLPSGYSVTTLLPGRDVVIDRFPANHAITVDGVRIVVPGLFYGQFIAVHGLGGILSLRSPVESRHRSSPMSHTPSYFTGNASGTQLQPSPWSPQGNRQNDNHTIASSISYPPSNSTGNHAFGVRLPSSPVSRPSNFTGNHAFRNHVPPPPPPSPQGNRQIDNATVSSSVSHPQSNFTGNHTSRNAPPPSPLLHGNDEIYNHTVVPDPANEGGLSPAISPVLGISAAPEPASVSTQKTHPKPSHGSSLLLSEYSSPYEEPSLAGEFFHSTWAMIHAPEDYRPLDEHNFDCPLTDNKPGSVDHSKINHGYLYTRQHYSVPTTTCTQTD